MQKTILFLDRYRKKMMLYKACGETVPKVVLLLVEVQDRMCVLPDVVVTEHWQVQKVMLATVMMPVLSMEIVVLGTNNSVNLGHSITF